MIEFVRAEEIDRVLIESSEITEHLMQESIFLRKNRPANNERIVLMWGDVKKKVFRISCCTPQRALENHGIIKSVSAPLEYGFDIQPEKLISHHIFPTKTASVALFAHRHPFFQTMPSLQDLHTTRRFGVGLIWCDPFDFFDCPLDDNAILFTAYDFSRKDISVEYDF